MGKWLASVVRGYFAYRAVPTNGESISAFRDQVIRVWRQALRRRSQCARMDWARMQRLAVRWIPPARIQHPWPTKRWDPCGGPLARAVPTATAEADHSQVRKDSPCGRPVDQSPGRNAKVVSLQRVAGLHHRYAWRQAA
jgi:hypothetical protein